MTLPANAVWIAEMGSEIGGSVFVARGGESIAKPRLLPAEPKALGQGLGGKPEIQG